ncbi:MAG: lyase family protein, partial [Betaproteobacteria bacterium]
MRTETDSLGDFQVPTGALYGIHTARALENFPLTGTPCSPALIRGLALVKQACAQTNAGLGFLNATVANAIVQACSELAAGEHLDAVPVDALQGGAGTSLNMNVNEVIANLAEEILGGRRGEYRRVHPVDHVNLHQSTNDVFP